jgi:hypothetical protein
MTRRKQRPNLAAERTIQLQIGSLPPLRLTATEGVLQRFAALLLYAGHEELLNDPEYQASLEDIRNGTLTLNLPTDDTPPPVSDVEQGKTDALRLMRQYMQDCGPVMAKKLLIERHGVERISDLDAQGLAALITDLRGLTQCE